MHNINVPEISLVGRMLDGYFRFRIRAFMKAL